MGRRVPRLPDYREAVNPGPKRPAEVYSWGEGESGRGLPTGLDFRITNVS